MKKEDAIRLMDDLKEVAREAEAERIKILAEPNVSQKEARCVYQETKARVETKAQEVKCRLYDGYNEAMEYIRTYIRINSDINIRQAIITDFEELIKTAMVDHPPKDLYPLPDLTLKHPDHVTFMQALYNTIEDKRKQGDGHKRGRKTDQRTLKEVIVQAIIKGRGYLHIENHDIGKVLQIWDEAEFEATKRVARLIHGTEKRKASPQEQAEYIISTLRTYGADLPSYNILKKALPSIAPPTTFYRYLRKSNEEKNGSE